MFSNRMLLVGGWLAAAVVLSTGVVHAKPAEPYVSTGKDHAWFSFSKPHAPDPAGQLAYAAELWSHQRFTKAFKAYRTLALTWPGSDEAATAQYMMGRILEQQKKWKDAFDAYQTLMDRYPGAFAYEEVLQRQFAIAKQEMNRKRGKFLLLPGYKAPEKAVELFEKIISNGPRTPIAPEAQFLIGQSYETSLDYELAMVAYMTTQQRYPASDYAEKAALGRARTLYKITREQPNDEASLEEAYAAAILFLNAYPDSEQADQVRDYRDNLFDRRVETAYSVAEYYDQIAKRPKAAMASYEKLIRAFPRSAQAEQARQRLEELSREQVETTDDEQTQD
ncbi:MAG: tetratricopeptide repeat protein [Kiritimatiellae bacterium]|nr:tetratricopeptide repeat protein [Kiritimatiellia bacterium]